MKRFLATEIREKRVKNLTELKNWILAFPDSEFFDMESMNAAILGRLNENGERVGGIIQRARAVAEYGGRSLQTFSREKRMAAPPVDLSEFGAPLMATHVSESDLVGYEAPPMQTRAAAARAAVTTTTTTPRGATRGARRARARRTRR